MTNTGLERFVIVDNLARFRHLLLDSNHRACTRFVFRRCVYIFLVTYLMFMHLSADRKTADAPELGHLEAGNVSSVVGTTEEAECPQPA